MSAVCACVRVFIFFSVGCGGVHNGVSCLRYILGLGSFQWDGVFFSKLVMIKDDGL